MKNKFPALNLDRVQLHTASSWLNPVFLPAFLLLLLAPSFCLAQEAEEPSPFEYRKQQAGYFGPEAKVPEPDGTEEILIAYFGPGDPDHPEYGEFWTALQIAKKNINAGAGINGKPVRFLPIWTEDPWKGGISDMVKTIYKQDIWALIGSVDSASTHLLEQVAAKARIPVINPVSTDKSANLANVPWLFSLLPGDHILARDMIPKIRSLLSEPGPFVLISGTDHDSRLLSREVKNLLSEEELVPAYIFDYQPDIPLPWDLFDEKTILFIVMAPPEESAALVSKIRDRFQAAKIIGGPFMGRNRFKELCGSECPDFSYVSPGSCSSDSTFAREFHCITGYDPDYADCSLYDAALLLRDAMEKSGLNRVRLLEAIRDITPWKGENGTISWDPLGQNTRQGSIKAGKN